MSSLSAFNGACAFALCTGASEIGLSQSSCTAEAFAIESELTIEITRARQWRYVWTGINGLSTLAPLVAVPLVRPDIRPDLIAGSIASALSTGLTFFWPLDIEAAPMALGSLAKLPPCQRIQAIRAIEASAAEDESARRAWPWHVANFGISAALGAVLVFGFDHPTGGVVTGLSGFVAGEVQLLTQPVGLRRETSLPTCLQPLLWPSPTGHIAVVGALLQWPLP